MYLRHFGLETRPFEVTPDPRFLYDGVLHREALAALTYGVQERRGFISLVGEVGTGKTTLLRTLLDSLDPSVRTALITHTTINPQELLPMILAELEIPVGGASRVDMLHRLQEFLLNRLRRGDLTLLILDEAQNLSPAVLEEVRLLTNLETSETKLLQVILAGQPELEQTLLRTELRQLRQRIAVHARVGPLTLEETRQYVRHRLLVAGRRRQTLFTQAAIHAVWKASEGIPRLINLLCDHCLVTAFAVGERQIHLRLVEEAAKDLGLTRTLTPRWRANLLWFLKRAGVVTAAAVALAAISLIPAARIPDVKRDRAPAQVAVAPDRQEADVPRPGHVGQAGLPGGEAPTGQEEGRR